MGEPRMAPGKAAYAAPQSDQDWLRNVQRELHRRSRDDLGYVFRKLWGFIVDPRTLRCAFHRVARNRGSRTAGIDGVTVGKLVRKSGGGDVFVQALREELKAGRFRPSPVRRVLIPKAGAPGKYRALGIPTVKDRVVQAALKSILEPIFEADFYPVSYGFRPGRGSTARWSICGCCCDRGPCASAVESSIGFRTNGPSRETSRDASTTSGTMRS